MGKRWPRGLALGGLLLLAVAGCSGAPATPTAAPTPSAAEATAETASFKFELKIGPVVTAATPDQFQDATAAEVMILMDHMKIIDRGQAVNRHLQIHVFDKRTGARQRDVLLGVRESGPAGSRELTNNDACLFARHKVFPHFGDNVYLAAGRYRFSATFKLETANFDVTV